MRPTGQAISMLKTDEDYLQAAPVDLKCIAFPLSL